MENAYYNCMFVSLVIAEDTGWTGSLYIECYFKMSVLLADMSGKNTRYTSEYQSTPPLSPQWYFNQGKSKSKLETLHITCNID